MWLATEFAISLKIKATNNENIDFDKLDWKFSFLSKQMENFIR